MDEDSYWERKRERMENQNCGDSGGPPGERMTAYLFLDEEQERLENQYNCQMSKLDESELFEIVEQFVKKNPISAEWNENMQGIKYQYSKISCISCA